MWPPPVETRSPEMLKKISPDADLSAPSSNIHPRPLEQQHRYTIHTDPFPPSASPPTPIAEMDWRHKRTGSTSPKPSGRPNLRIVVNETKNPNPNLGSK
jgi:hypothetical protein